jgi:cell wall assembly regulator SMI1
VEQWLCRDIHSYKSDSNKWRINNLNWPTRQRVQNVEHPLENKFPLQLGHEHYAHNVYEQKSIQDTITYLHACCFSPVQDTWIKAIHNGHFATWPSITVENVRKYLPKSDATAKGHMNQIRQHIRSTQPSVEQPAPET